MHRRQYLFAQSTTEQPDLFDTGKERFRLCLKETSRENFHQILRTCLEDFLIVKDEPIVSNGFLTELSKQADQPFYSNSDPFDCLTCLNTVEAGHGILVRQCLHPLCKECLIQLIETSTEPTVRCPHDNCAMLIGERELRGVGTDRRRSFIPGCFAGRARSEGRREDRRSAAGCGNAFRRESQQDRSLPDARLSWLVVHRAGRGEQSDLLSGKDIFPSSVRPVSS